MNTTKEHYEVKGCHKIDFLRNQTECPVCNGHLDINIDYECEEGFVREEGRCSQCMALSYVEKHVVH